MTTATAWFFALFLKNAATTIGPFTRQDDCVRVRDEACKQFLRDVLARGIERPQQSTVALLGVIAEILLDLLDNQGIDYAS